jgi:hypothetical protein
MMLMMQMLLITNMGCYRYVPQMLEGPARIWLNNLPAGSINGWVDFEEQFVSNFTSTYKRPNHP